MRIPLAPRMSDITRRRTGRAWMVAATCFLTSTACADPAAGGPGTAEAALEQPSIAGPLKPNPRPASFEADLAGNIFVSGIVTGYGLAQDAVMPGDRARRVDFSNLQTIVQKADGPLQFYVQTGLYAIPALGLANTSALEATSQQFGPVPVAFAKVKIDDALSLSGGKLPTLIPGENTFTFQNFNIVRGLLFGQSNNINRGMQADLKLDKTTVSLSLNDGFYSGKLNWLIGAVSHAFDDTNTLIVSAASNLGRTRFESVAAPLLQNNSSIYNVSYNHQSGPWLLAPYAQFTHVKRDLVLGIQESASTYGGAVLASYAFTPEFALAGRVEYIAQSGNRDTGSTSLLYGPGSRAFSATVTPTYQVDRYFVRGEYSLVQLFDVTPGQALGRTGLRTRQNRFAIETGVLF